MAGRSLDKPSSPARGRRLGPVPGVAPGVRACCGLLNRGMSCGRIGEIFEWVGVAALAGSLGCGSSRGTTASAGTGGSGAASGSGGNGGMAAWAGTASGGSAGRILVGGVGGGGGVSMPGCSTDRHHVLGQNGEVVQTCPPDQACDDARCVPACAAFASIASSVGCEFLAATPSVMSLYRPGCFAIFVANAWNRATPVSIERDGQTYDAATIGRIVGAGSDATAWGTVPDEGIAPDEVLVLFLSHDPMANSGDNTDTRCPVPPAVSDVGGAAVFDKALDAPKLDPADLTGRGAAFRIRTESPVSVYSIVPYGGAQSVDPGAALLYPTSVWGKNYIATLPPVMYPGELGTEPWAQIVALEDDTSVELAPSSDLPGGGGVAATPAGAVATFTLGAGELIQWQPTLDWSGTALLADRPIAFYGGQSSFLRDSSMPECENGASDNAHQQMAPIPSLGSEYVAAPYRSRVAIPESVPYRVVGLANGTSLAYDPPQTDAPSALDEGSVRDFESTEAFTIRSQDAAHPFYVAQIMPGCGMGNPTGDEEFVNVIPARQFLDRYVFFTDPTYATTNLVLVRTKGSAGFADVNVDCLGTLSGWRDVGTQGLYQTLDVDLVRANVPVGSCQNGRHVAESEMPFALVVWGLDHFASYAYPAGSGAARLNDVVVPPVVR